MACRGQAAVPVRRADRRRVVERLPGRVDDDVRDAARRELLPHRLAEIGEDRDHAGRPAGQDALHPAATGRPPALHLAQDDREVMLPGDALDATDDLERPLALELVEDHLEERRPGPRAGRPAIAVLADRGLDAASRLGRHVRPPVDHLGHGRHRHAGQLGDVGDRRGRGTAGTGRTGRGHGRSVANGSVQRKFRRERCGQRIRPRNRTDSRDCIDTAARHAYIGRAESIERALRNFRGGDRDRAGRVRRPATIDVADRRFRPRQTPPPWRGGIAHVGHARQRPGVQMIASEEMSSPTVPAPAP